MEFEELQKVWTGMTNESFYEVNEQVLFNRIIRKKKSVHHVTNSSELLTILVNLATGLFIFLVNVYGKENTWLYLMSAWMLATAVYGLFHRTKRLGNQPAASSSINDHLNQAIHIAASQVRLSWLMRMNILPVALLTSIGLWTAGKSPALVAGLTLFFLLCFYFSGWEHAIYVRKKNELELLKGKLEE